MVIRTNKARGGLGALLGVLRQQRFSKPSSLGSLGGV